jgi:translation initiation factor IF-1
MTTDASYTMPFPMNASDRAKALKAVLTMIDKDEYELRTKDEMKVLSRLSSTSRD